MSTPRPRVVLADGVPMSGLVAEVDDPRAVIVAFHGGSTTAAYFDCPGYPQLSLLRAGAAAGYTTVALDRPGYGSSAPYPEAMDRPEQRVALASGALDKVLGTKPRGAGVFLMGHSAGCEMALRMATELGADVLGLELAGSGVRYTAAMAEIMKATMANQRPVGLRELLWTPEHVYPPEVLSGMTNSSGGARYEIEVTKNWPRQDFPALASQVRVPVQFSVAEFERVWRSDPQMLAQIGAMFTSAPRFVVNEQAGSGHNLSLSVAADAYHAKVLAFVEECVLAQQGLETG
ncbi:thioesterase [Mycobacterium holsaticum DSM 44478]|nr:thioesterase [Mycolicibacterium holsaticum DSM 44478 = JCM 12374]